MDYRRAVDIKDAISLRQQMGYPFVAGGTDIYPAIENGARFSGLIDVSRVEALRGKVRQEGDAWVIPALASWTDIVDTDLPPLFDSLKQAAAEVGGRQIQNAGTVAGNICNASPAADGIPALMAMDAKVVIAGPAGEREVSLEKFVLGNRKIDLNEGELLRAVKVPARTTRTASAFRKLGARRYLVISIVMAAATLECEKTGKIVNAGISVGACAARALRLSAWEAALRGRKIGEIASLAIDPAFIAPLAPMDDIRGAGEYRKHAAGVLVREALMKAAVRLDEQVA
ncbi:MAG: FAD binding domain-containing protein [Xanthobacteraceae bacterium]|nr:FAD binding domain-containing protein [Xanthobacteraceae bacterium]QYK45694.1 MAG: FAD binding domain-containing protein [Xanthobacteraceae bacterium]